MTIEFATREEWLEKWMEICYPQAFLEHRPKELEKCNYALIVRKDEDVVCFVTCIEMDGESVYWQFGGAFEKFKKSIHAMAGYKAMIGFAKNSNKRIVTRIDNTNIPMLRMAMAAGFLIQGTWCIHGRVYVELLNEFGGR